MPALSTPVSRRRLFGLAASAAVAWQVAPWADRVARALSVVAPATPASVVPTLEAFSDTLIPGAKRGPGDRAIAGAAPGPGAVQAGAIAMMEFPAAGIGPALPELATLLNLRAEAFTAQHAIVADPTVPPMVALDFDERTQLLIGLLDPSQPDYLVWFALAAMPFLAFHTAGYLPTATATAMRQHHPGLEAIGFPAPDPDGRWRWPVFSYRRPLAATHPGTSASGSPP